MARSSVLRILAAFSAQERTIFSVSRFRSKNSTSCSPATLPVALDASWLSSLVYDPEVPDEFWPERLKEELRNIGRGCRHRFSLSLGCSHLRNKDGSLKSMGEWKYEADRKLYENKKKGDLKNGVY